MIYDDLISSEIFWKVAVDFANGTEREGAKATTRLLHLSLMPLNLQNDFYALSDRQITAETETN